MVKIGTILLAVDVIIGVYLINAGLNFIVLPEFFLSVNKWIIALGGGLLIIGGLMSMKGNSDKHFRH